jgi:hypothetical protein
MAAISAKAVSETVTGGNSASALLSFGSDGTGPGLYVIGTFVANSWGRANFDPHPVFNRAESESANQPVSGSGRHRHNPFRVDDYQYRCQWSGADPHRGRRTLQWQFHPAGDHQYIAPAGAVDADLSEHFQS